MLKQLQLAFTQPTRNEEKRANELFGKATLSLSIAQAGGLII